MRSLRDIRRVALLALLAMAWSALLPFTAAARMLVADGPVEHCHRLNVDSVIDPDPAAPEGPSQPRKASCPFCASALAAPPPSPPPLPAFVRMQNGVRASPFLATTSGRATIALPPSRAPPAATHTTWR